MKILIKTGKFSQIIVVKQFDKWYNVQKSCFAAERICASGRIVMTDALFAAKH